MMLLRKLETTLSTNDGRAGSAAAAAPGATVFALRVKATESCSKYGSEKSICFRRSSVSNMSAMITSIFPLASAAMSPENSWSANRTSLPRYAPNRLAISTSKPASSLFCTALKGKPPLEIPTTSVPVVAPAGRSGILRLRLVIQRSTMSAQTPF
jgi:hypothetical protein